MEIIKVFHTVFYLLSLAAPVLLGMFMAAFPQNPNGLHRPVRWLGVVVWALWVLAIATGFYSKLSYAG
jgi:hypothetical protein